MKKHTKIMIRVPSAQLIQIYENLKMYLFKNLNALYKIGNKKRIKAIAT